MARTRITRTPSFGAEGGNIDPDAETVTIGTQVVIEQPAPEPAPEVETEGENGTDEPEVESGEPGNGG